MVVNKLKIFSLRAKRGEKDRVIIKVAREKNQVIIKAAGEKNGIIIKTTGEKIE